MRTSPSRLWFLSLLGAVLGVAGGGAAYVLLHLIGLITNLTLFHRFGWQTPSFADHRFGPLLFVATIGGGFLVSLLAVWSPVIRGHGIPEAMEAVLENQSRISPRAAIAKPLSAAIAIGTGGPFGAEGPIIVTGGALGSLIGQVLHVSPSERKVLLACGAAAGMAATFGSPLAAVVLAIELLLFEFSTRAFIPLVVASSVAAGFHTLFFGPGPLFAVPRHAFAGLDKLPFFAVVGLASGLLAIVVTKGLFAIEAGFRRLPVPVFWHPMIGAVLFAAVGLAVPRALGVGYDSIGATLAGRFALGTLAVLFLAKLCAWWVALASGTSGGTLAPLLLVGGSFGGMLGIAGQHVFPGLHISPGAVAMVAMAATFGASTRATFASIVFLFEITRDFDIILPLMLASVLADLLSVAFMRESIMTDKLARRGLTVRAEFGVDVLESTRVRQVMTREVVSVPEDETIAGARARMVASGHGAFPLLDAQGRLAGIVTRGDLLSADADGPVGAVASRDVVTAAPDDLLLTVLERMFDESIEHLPVLAEGALVGIVTRTDLLRARRRSLELETVQPGWGNRASRRGRRRGSASDSR